MDYTDYKIIEILQKDGRISMKDLGKAVNMTSPAVAERVRKLEESGVISGYKAIIAPGKLNKNIMAFISVGLAPENYQAFIDYAEKNEKIIECHHVTGGVSVIIKVLTENMSDLKNLIDEIKKKGSTQTSVILSSPIESKLIRK
ncbi:Lrp/AsnC family leucine-responsive transcriptional regulator [Anaerosolibacter carboniphilus]|uniref:Lrp/AsnC family leucine-responsive transcriptional regulator n=1 Tax=Anaerosolibacter carboniphilus TaxID=1417629 RepID=A0A841KVH0_9FIRM|nr:Lrp/AsnC family transcriptional regulator [Anaerosolibacter carboniphilus]MBB6217666.1 Lrp/AsnC family leucine-responsive transcriptional regulator [Anaerosolibacter carboniphilus]